MRQKHDGISYPKRWANHVRSWMKQSNVNLLKYEDIVMQTNEVLIQISKQLKIDPLFEQPLLPKKLVPQNRLQDYWLRVTRQFESTAIDSKYSSSKVSWKELFTQEDHDFFFEEAGDVLLELGYQKK
ncbi:MAG: hypothetical protein ACP5DZ_11390 [Bacteroidales bacterium]